MAAGRAIVQILIARQSRRLRFADVRLRTILMYCDNRRQLFAIFVIGHKKIGPNQICWRVKRRVGRFREVLDFVTRPCVELDGFQGLKDGLWARWHIAENEQESIMLLLRFCSA